jgi:hypothetical protein
MDVYLHASVHLKTVTLRYMSQFMVTFIFNSFYSRLQTESPNSHIVSIKKVKFPLI